MNTHACIKRLLHRSFGARCCTTCLLFTLFLPGRDCLAADQTVAGNLSVTGTVEVDGNSLFIGTQGSSPGLSITYADAASDTLTSFLNRNPASWLWAHSASIAAMRLTSNHELVLYNPDGQTPAITLASAGVPGGPYMAVGGVRFEGTSGAVAMTGGLTAQKLTLSDGFNSNVNINNTAFLSAHHPTGMRMTVIGTNMYWDGGTYVRPNTSEPGLSLELHQGVNAFRFVRYAVGASVDVVESSIGTNGNPTYFNMFGGNVGIGTDRPAHKLTVRGGGMAVDGPILIPPQGDLPMGNFTQGPQPTF